MQLPNAVLVCLWYVVYVDKYGHVDDVPHHRGGSVALGPDPQSMVTGGPLLAPSSVVPWAVDRVLE